MIARRPGWMPFVLGGLIAASLGLTSAAALGPSLDPPPGACTDPDEPGLEVGCVPGGTLGQFHRQTCDYQWVEAACGSTALDNPGYAATAEPDPSAPLALRVGAVHEHSGYSDGDPDAVPRDYFRAGRTGHNLGDDGTDTGVVLDFILSSEHSDNTQIPITTNAACIDPSSIPAGIEELDASKVVPPLQCNHAAESDDYWKWPATLRQAREETERSPSGDYTGFTGMRGFEWTNDYFNHMNVYLSTNFRNVKIDGSYLTMDVMWDWLRRPVAEGGGADGLVTFNHPGGDPKLTPFDGGQPHTRLLQELKGGANWNNVEYVPDVDDNVVGIEVNGGDDIEWYVKALTNGWHLGPVAAEDEHQREWATVRDGKTLVLTRGRSPQDYYFSLQHHRTIAVRSSLIGGTPGTPATFPTIHFYADGTSIQDSAATLLGSTASGPGLHTLMFEASGLAPGSRIALISNTGGGQVAPIQYGEADAFGNVVTGLGVQAPTAGEDWYFAVVCPPGTGDACGTNQSHVALTAPIWIAP